MIWRNSNLKHKRLFHLNQCQNFQQWKSSRKSTEKLCSWIASNWLYSDLGLTCPSVKHKHTVLPSSQLYHIILWWKSKWCSHWNCRWEHWVDLGTWKPTRAWCEHVWQNTLVWRCESLWSWCLQKLLWLNCRLIFKSCFQASLFFFLCSLMDCLLCAEIHRYQQYWAQFLGLLSFCGWK